MTKFVLFLFGLLMFACGGPVDDGSEYDPEFEFEQLEQAITGTTTPSFQHGTQTGGDRNRCNRTSTGQVCAVPPKRVLSVCIHTINFLSPSNPPPLLATTEATQIKNMINTTFEPRTGWTYQIDDVLGDGSMLADCFIRTPVADITIFAGSVGSSGTGSNNVKDYQVTTFGGLVGLTEGAGVVGSYQRWTTCNVKLDRTDILAKGTTANEDMNGMQHAAGHGVGACVGIGTAGTNGNRAARSLFQPGSVATALTAGEGCALDNYSSVLQSQYNQTNLCTVD